MKAQWILILAVLVTLAAISRATPGALAQDYRSDCPDSRVHLEPRLQTTPQDGKAYAIQLKAIQMPIDEVLELMGGVERAFAIAEQTRAQARALIEQGATGVERRFLEDTILRSNELEDILHCRGTTF